MTTSFMQKGRMEKGTFPVTDEENRATCVVNAQTRPMMLRLLAITHQNQKGIREQE